MPVKITGTKEAIRHMQARSKAFKGETPSMYNGLSVEMRRAINQNSDSSYKKSPAKTLALESTKVWNHQKIWHRLKIMSTDYANYRQYGCGGIDIRILVQVLQENKDAMKLRVFKAFSK